MNALKYFDLEIIILLLFSGNVKYPIDGPYQNSTIKRYNELYPLGKTAIDVPNDANNEPDCVGRIIPVVLRWTG